MTRRVTACIAVLPLVGAALSSQANTDPALDVLLANIGDLDVLGRAGTFPDGVNGCALATTACNAGTKEINWQQAMDPDHPFIAFLLARQSAGRLVQISDRSYVKHGFFALSSSFCTPCTPTDGSTLGLGCSDTYATSNNGDNYWLGPPEEIDPWLGLWDPICSHFDRGEPPVPFPGSCNGVRSLTFSQAQALGPVGHRVQVRDSQFDVAGATFWAQAMYVVEGEGEALRANNIGSRGFTPTWNGARWNVSLGVAALQHGSVLERWSGASVSSATNGGDDGRLYVATRVSGPFEGFWHYELAVHNRDNQRGVGSLRIPVCSGARVRNLGFSDVDIDPGNDWTAALSGGEIAYSGTSNPLEWNTIFNFWFDSDAAPVASPLSLDQVAAGPGLATVAVMGVAPLELYNVFVGGGCALDEAPRLFASGTPPRATLGNATFAVRSAGNAPFQPSFLYFSSVPGPLPFRGCTVHLGGAPLLVSMRSSDAAGLAIHPAPIPNDIALEGLDGYVQAVSRDPGNGTLYRDYELSEGLRVRTGSSLPGCP